MGVNTFTIEVAPILYPQFQDFSLLQALLTNLGIVLPNEVINHLNDSAEENASVGGQGIGRKVVVGGQVIIGADESNEDALLSNYSDSNNCSDDNVNA